MKPPLPPCFDELWKGLDALAQPCLDAIDAAQGDAQTTMHSNLQVGLAIRLVASGLGPLARLSPGLQEDLVRNIVGMLYDVRHDLSKTTSVN